MRTAFGTVLLPLPWSVAPPLPPRLELPEVLLMRKDELHLTLLSSAEAAALDAASGEAECWRRLLAEDPIETHSIELDGRWWLLHTDKPDGEAWSVIALARCSPFDRFRARAAAASAGAIASDPPAHVTLYVAGDPRGIGLPSRLAFEQRRVRALQREER